MRTLAATFILVLIMLACWGGFMLYTGDTSDVLVSSMNDVYECADEGDWDGALTACDDFLCKWDGNSKVYGIYMENISVHDIELSAKRCRAYICAQNRALTLGESASITAHLKLLQESDRVSPKNIL